MLTFEGNQVMGSEAIIQKLTSIGNVQHEVKSMDVQPSQDSSAMIIFVTGTVRISGENPLHFCEVRLIMVFVYRIDLLDACKSRASLPHPVGYG